MTFVHANDAAMGDLGYERREADHYPTPAWVTEAVVPFLFEHIEFDAPVWECACGEGKMSDVLKQHFDNVTSTDLYDYGYASADAGVDFLAFKGRMRSRGLLITNPPYGDLAEAFIRKALEITRATDGVVAMLVRHEYDCAKGRVDLFNKPPFAKKIVLTTRPRWIPDSTGAPRHSYAWMIFDWAHTGPATVHYHVLKGKSQ